jgi:hypothetical protein
MAAIFAIYHEREGTFHMDPDSTYERFSSIKAAKDAMQMRGRRRWGRATQVKISEEGHATWGNASTQEYHEADETAYMDLYVLCWIEPGIAVPGDGLFARLTLGPRGGVIRENA